MTRVGYVVATSFAAMGIAVAAFAPMPPVLVWNATASVPVGLYAVVPADRLQVDDLVAAAAPTALARFLDERGYLPAGVPLLKRVAALPGQRVCRDGSAITVDGFATGAALEHDSLGRDLPRWSGCRLVAAGEVFLMNPQVRDSLDGRYFGPVPAGAVIGRAIPLYIDEHRDGRFAWRAPMRAAAHP